MPTHQNLAPPTRQPQDAPHGARIKVVGVGGGGSNALDRMIASRMEGVEFIAFNTDVQALQTSKAPIRGQIGARLTNGLGAGSDPDIGRRAALQDSDMILEVLNGADMVFVTAGLGGGTGTGAAPVIAAIASEMGALTVAIVTRPFNFEGKRRMAIADWGVHHLLDYVDTLIVIPNEKLLALAKDAPFFESFRVADDFLRDAVQGISDIITTEGVINRDFADVKTTMAGMGYAVMGTASRSGPNRAVDAVMEAMASPLLEPDAIDGARGILINITGSSSLRLSEVNAASRVIQSVAHEDANIIFGAVLDERLGGAVKVTVVATGFRSDGRDRSARRARLLRGPEQEKTADPPSIQSASTLTPPVEDQAVQPTQEDAYADSQEPPQPFVEQRPAMLEETQHDVEIPDHPENTFTDTSLSLMDASLSIDRLATSDTLPTEESDLEFSQEQDWRDAIREIARLAEPHIEAEDLNGDGLEVAAAFSTHINAEEGSTSQSEGHCDVDEDAYIARNPARQFNTLGQDAPHNAPGPDLAAGLRQAAIASYAAISSSLPEPSVSEASQRTSSTAFVEILEARRRFVEGLSQQSSSAEPASSSDTLYLDEAEQTSDRHVAAAFHGDSMDDDEDGQLVFGERAITEAKLPVSPAAPSIPLVQPVAAIQAGAEGLSNTPRPKSATATENPVAPTRLTADDNLPAPLPEFNRRLNRDNNVDRSWETSETGLERGDRVPLFASVLEEERYTDEFDELDIPAFLRRGH